ncbi:hypothetical protein CLU95_2464 [Variovorax sp. 54]|uniref:terpene synthase family protein n=1 Tax=Variovorax sp. 54 TaxID=2035212 RepID=UPI000C19145D|nr:terpene synthase family protein [Variovorax sp. 54]PIF75317.1 hypothetical protein CLU95_2464 [Variovorax sp. 54]
MNAINGNSIGETLTGLHAESPPRFVIPRMQCAVEPRINTHYPIIRWKHSEWIYENFGPPVEGRLHGAIARMDSLYDSSVLPDGLADRVAHHAGMMTMVFECDDLSVIDPALCDRIVAGDPNAHGARVLDQVWKTFRKHAPTEGVYERLRGCWTRWLHNLTVENQVRKNWRDYDIDSYLHERQKSAGMYAYVAAIEYVQDIDAIDVVQDPDGRRAGHLVDLHCALVNDLYSYGVEYYQGDAVNSINILCHTRGYSVQQSIDAVSERIAKINQELVDVIHRLHERYAEHPLGARMHTYLDSYHSIVAGNAQWHLETPRYHGLGHVWDGRREMHVNVAFSPRGKLEGAGAPVVVQ